jgi:isopenicillin N synthase-like dioxygenase
MMTFTDDAPHKPPSRFEDIPEELLKCEQEMGTIGGEVLGYMAETLGIESDYLGGGDDRKTCLTLHRVTPNAKAHMAAEEHFDFNLCNVLLYNYCTGFKVYCGEQWYQFAEPKHPNMFLFNLSSCLSIRSNRNITSLLHRVDTPIDESLPQRLSIVCPIVSQLHERIIPHPSLITEEDPNVFEPHSYRDHVFYASKHSTALNKHVHVNIEYKGFSFKLHCPP